MAGEEERGTLDLLLAHPARRREYVVQRFLALAALVAALAIVLLAAVALGSWLVDLEIGFGKLLAASISVALLALLFGAIALAVGALRPGRARAIAVAAGLAVAAWIFDGLAQAVDALEPWRPSRALLSRARTEPAPRGSALDRVGDSRRRHRAVGRLGRDRPRAPRRTPVRQADEAWGGA